MNKKTIVITEKEYEEIIAAMRQGQKGYFKPNKQIVEILTLEANLGLRVGDVLCLKLSNIIKDGNRYRLDITEQKTKKKRTFTVPSSIYEHIRLYCLENNIDTNERMFNISSRQVQQYLAKVVNFLELDKNISTHSFRKFFATRVYENNDYNIVLVQTLLQHSSAAITQKYIGIGSKEIEEALAKNVIIV